MTKPNYRELIAQSTKELIVFLQSSQAGDVMDEVWRARRDVLIEHAQAAIKD